ncbi:hypothetical protein SAMN05444274_101389 [Mariniphaga anaerophila]|uniref:Long-chain fatty acid transport protein n=1 Tax=Mariniphaga anaerophila TaxID=1484053 RepID=A0A1M4TLB9_9BACT|nr:hypothetical protein [Mariniphaga anaerophila]SHE45087.1 hypothetical protein SAMN05444274_101389 [Mariniphaga anaerophila]
MIQFKNIAFLLLLLFGSFMLHAQNTMSPYSIFGPGEMLPKGFGRSIGMGNSGIALSSGSQLNNLNPASYAGIEKHHVVFEFGVEGKFSTFKSYDDKMSGFNGSLKYVAMGYRVTPWLSSSIGLSPYSTVGYKINTENSMEGSLLNYNSSFEGSGGITLAYWAHSVKLSDNLFFGVNTSFLFGPLTQQESIYQSDLGMNYISVQNDYMSSFYFDFGLQYAIKKGNTEYRLGLTYAPEQSLRSKHTYTLMDGNYSTLAYDEESPGHITIPQTTGLGVSVQNGENYLVALDYRTEKWKGLHYPTMSGNFVNAHNFSVGTEFRPWRQSVTNVFYKNWVYRFGLNYNSTFLKLRNNRINEYSVNFGFGFPLRERGSSLNVAFEAGSNGTTENNLVRERFLLLHVNFSLNELWFFQRKFE